VWRNYVRGITNKAPETTPAMALRIAPRPLGVAELLAVLKSRPAAPGAPQAAGAGVEGPPAPVACQ